MKWSNQEVAPPFSYLNFKELLIDMIKGWKSLRILHANEHKSLLIHIITNRKASLNDDVIGRDGNKVGNFNDFLNSVYAPIKSKATVLKSKLLSYDKFLQSDKENSIYSLIWSRNIIKASLIVRFPLKYISV